MFYRRTRHASSAEDAQTGVALHAQAGFTLVEMMISIAVLMIVSGAVFSGVTQLTNVNESVRNRSEMHAGIRNATELLQQEVAQAGRVALPGIVTLSGAVAGGTATVAVSSTAGMFVGERLTIDTGANQETVELTAVDGANNTVTAAFAAAHGPGVPVSVHGGFPSGVVPSTMANGSSGTVLKMFGDISGTGHITYVEYTCDSNAGSLYRNAMAYDAGQKPALTLAQVLLTNLAPNPDGAPCFTYHERTIAGTAFVVQIGTTLTVRTARRDAITRLYQTETNALVNMTPRNVVQVWQLAGLGIDERLQPMPGSVAALLP